MATTTIHEAQHAADAWQGFAPGPWQQAIDVRDFIQRNYTAYDGDSSFLAGPTERTAHVWQTLTAMFPEERAKGVYDVDAATPSTITSHAPGYIDKDRELVVGLQTDRSEEQTSELQSRGHLVCRLLLEKKNIDAGA